ncbi:hypothetical protein ACFO0N_01985 [Halobium salinum]|uniref:Uncharacterized protein n=1 Tax=Halobium salinum TaxID=1364940 RepID=A0ABD5P794_9EURY|nr:hypothetical protein [Halobium salinum]
MEGDVRTLERRLHALKRRGANVLLVGVPEVDAACGRLLGSDDEDRRRLFVLGDGATTTPASRADQWGRDPMSVGVVEVPSEGTRSAAASRPIGDGGPAPDGPDEGVDDAPDRSDAAGSDAAPDAPRGPVEPVGPATGPANASVPWARESETPWYSRTEPGDLTAAARHVHVHLSRFEVADPEPSEVRVCLDPLDGLAAGADPAAVRRFLQVVTDRVRMSRGMAHYHLPAAADGFREDVTSLFDATVETQSIDGDPYQRWTLHSEELKTDWLPL